MKFIPTRFSLKTQMRAGLVATVEAADPAPGNTGPALFEGTRRIWKMHMRSPDHPGTKRLPDRTTSQAGRRAVAGFAPEGAPPFVLLGKEAQGGWAAAQDGDAREGHEISRTKCARRHTVDAATGGWGTGATPSFGVLRALPDWEGRFSAFYIPKPHPAFTRTAGGTDPFPIGRPSPVAPVALDLDELKVLMACLAALPAADLGGPLEHQ